VEGREDAAAAVMEYDTSELASSPLLSSELAAMPEPPAPLSASASDDPERQFIAGISASKRQRLEDIMRGRAVSDLCSSPTRSQTQLQMPGQQQRLVPRQRVD
jgi:hypothetical protein